MASNQQNIFNNISNKEQQQHDTTTISPQEAQTYRATAQQNSIDAIRSAEERYSKAKDSGSSAFQHTKDTVIHGAGAGTDYITAKGYQAADFTAEKGSQGYEVAKEAAIAAAQKTAEVAKLAAVKVKDVTVSAGQSALNYVTGESGDVKETSLGKTGEIGEVKEKVGEEEGRGGRKNVAEERL